MLYAMNAASQTQSPRGTHLTKILSNRQLCPGHYLLCLGTDDFPPTRPGQFVQLQCRTPGSQPPWREVRTTAGQWPKLTGSELAGTEPLLRRPLSLAGRRDVERGVELDIIYSVVGTGTRWLSGAAVGDAISVLGPLGNAFTISDDKPRAVLVGGGVGIPPMIYLASAMQDAGKTATAFCGARSAGALPVTIDPDAGISDTGAPGRCVDEFSRFGVESVIATDDGSLGWGGFVSEPVEAWLDSLDDPGRGAVVYACGPEPMMHAVADICFARGVECQVSLERHMACGMGTCQSCICRTVSDTQQGWSYKLCCTDGPVFDAREIVW